MALVCSAATTAVLMSGFLPTRTAAADDRGGQDGYSRRLNRVERRAQRADMRARQYKAAYQELRAAMVRMENVAGRQVRNYQTRTKLQRIGVNARRRAARYIPGSRPIRPYPVQPVRPAPPIHVAPPVVIAPPPVVIAPPPVVIAPPSQPGYYRPQRITQREFVRFRNSVRREAFDSGKLALVRDMARRVAFTSRQVATLMRLCTFDDGRIKIGAALYPSVVDPASWFRVYDTMTFSSSKKKLRKRIRRQDRRNRHH